MRTVQAFIAANRFGMGAAPGELEYLSHDPQGALLQQLANPVWPVEFGGLPTSDDALQEAARIQMQRQELLRVSTGTTAAGAMAAAKAMGQQIRDIYNLEASRRTMASVSSPTPLVERLVEFWGGNRRYAA